MNEGETGRAGQASDSKPGQHHHGGTGHAHHAHHESAPDPDVTPLDFWEARYRGEERVWSGKVNVSLAETIDQLTPGRSVDLGCGEGADVLWLAERGWQASGLDISPTAINRARQEADARGLSPEQASFVVTDLATWQAEASYDLVSASFLHSPVPLAREQILQQAAAAVRPGGHLLVISHAAPADPNDVSHPHADLHHHPEDEYRELKLDETEWTLTRAGRRNRMGRKPTGEPIEVEDLIVLARRR